ncbi:MAG: MarP family serine protease [Candidatus Limnocylindria bacterium]
MNLLDLLVILLLLLGVIAGARAGFLGPVLGLGGAVAGFAVALILASLFRPTLVEIDQPLRGLVTLVGLGMLILGGEAAGGGLGASLSHGLHRSAAQPLDMVGGAFVGVAHVVLLVWLIGGMLAAGMAPAFGALARDSIAIRLVTDRLPPPATVAGRLLALLDTTELPQLFAGIEPPPAPPVDLSADADARALAESAVASTAQVVSTGCGAWQQVGSGFFVSATHAVTNAHVVAGSDSTTVSVAGASLPATVVLFDPQADLALLHVAGADAPALQLSAVTPARGQPGVALGYPGGGNLTVEPAAVTASYDIVGPDIYGEGRVDRSVVEMRAEIRRGNSGGPLVIAPGVVGGVVFGASRTSPDVGYAIAATEAAARIGPAIGSTAPVGTGPCG